MRTQIVFWAKLMLFLDSSHNLALRTTHFSLGWYILNYIFSTWLFSSRNIRVMQIYMVDLTIWRVASRNTWVKHLVYLIIICRVTPNNLWSHLIDYVQSCLSEYITHYKLTTSITPKKMYFFPKLQLDIITHTKHLQTQENNYYLSGYEETHNIIFITFKTWLYWLQHLFWALVYKFQQSLTLSYLLLKCQGIGYNNLFWFIKSLKNSRNVPFKDTLAIFKIIYCDLATIFDKSI